MAYTQQQIKAEGDKMLASGASASDLWGKAQQFGVSMSDLAGAYGMTEDQGSAMVAPSASTATSAAPTISTNKTPSVWAGAPLSDRQVAEAKDYISKQLGGDGSLPGWGAAFDANGRYNPGNEQRDQRLAGWQQAMGVSDADMARITGYTPEEVARAKSGMGAGSVDIGEEIFRTDNPRLFPGGGAGGRTGGAGRGVLSNAQGAPTGPILGNPGAPNTMFVNPWTREVDPATMTTQGQLDSILAKNSLLMQRAEGLAMSKANERGMQNSSMAAGAGAAAMIDAATPIAKADADAYAQASMDNQKYGNAAAVFNSQAYNDAQMAGFNASQEILKLDMKIGADKYLAHLSGDQKLDQIGAQGRIERELQTLKNSTSLELANIEAQYKTTMQGSESARSLYTEISKNITNIMTNKDIPAEEKTRLVAQQSELLRSGLAIAGASANTDFLRILDFTGGTASTGTGNAVNTGPTPAPTPAPVITGGSGWINPYGGAGGDAAGSGVGTSGVGSAGDGSDGGGIGGGISV